MGYIKETGKMGSAAAIAFAGGFQTGKELSSQTVTIAPPPHEFYMENDPNRFKIAEQLKAAGVRVIVDEVEMIEDEVPQ